jgi:hypothetical protein
MTPTEIFDIFEKYPDSAFRLTLSSGDTVDVYHPRLTLMEELALHVGQPRDSEARFAKNIRIVSIPNIAMVEKIDRRLLNGRRRRR